MKFLKITEDKLEKILRWRTSPEVTKYMYTDPKPDMELQKKWYKEKVINSKTDKYWTINFEGSDVGLVSLNNIDLVNQRCYWAYYIGETSFLGKGIGKQVELNIMDYVFNKMKLNKLCCEVFCFNETVIKIHEKFGSKIEGTLRKHIFKNGKYFDIVTMGILQDEWQIVKNNFQISYADIED